MNCSLSYTMGARALLSSLSLTPKTPPDISAQKRNHCLGFKHKYPFHFRIRVRLSSESQQERCHVNFRVSARSSSGERGGGKVRADVKSEPYDISDSIPESVKFGEAMDGVVLGKKELELDSESEIEIESSVPWWEQFPKRWVIVVLCFSAFLLCNMDRVNMSIAILPMSAEFNWNPATVGLIQSSFFWGYLLTQIAGGIWADTVGGKMVLGFGVVWWSIATILTPIAAKIGLPFLLVVRAFMGIGEGVAMPAMNNLLSKWVPVAERSRSLALVYSGMYLGSVTGLAFSPFLIQHYGWPSVFFSFGSLGTVWIAVWLSKIYLL